MHTRMCTHRHTNVYTCTHAHTRTMLRATHFNISCSSKQPIVLLKFSHADHISKLLHQHGYQLKASSMNKVFCLLRTRNQSTSATNSQTMGEHQPNSALDQHSVGHFIIKTDSRGSTQRTPAPPPPVTPALHCLADL